MPKFKLISQSNKVTDESNWGYESTGTYEVTLTKEETKELLDGAVATSGTC